MTFMIFPYTQGSESAKAIAEELEGKRILRQNSTYKAKDEDVIINWGASDCPFPQALNADVSPALDKLKFFEKLKGKNVTPNFATSKVQAAAMLKFPVFCRTQIKGHDGAGIVVAKNWEELVDAPLYVEGFSKTTEYRIHVGINGKGQYRVIGAQKKIHENVPGTHPDVWVGESTKFVWTVNGQPVAVPGAVSEAVSIAFVNLGMDFAAFDVMYDSNTGTAAVLEANSAPMMTPETAKRYAEFFREFVPEPVAAPAPESVMTSTPVIAPPVTIAPSSSLLAEIEKVLAGSSTVKGAAQSIHELVLARIA